MGKLSSEDKRIRGRKGVALRRRRMARTNWLCEHCGARGIVTVAQVVNHKIPLIFGGEDVDDNTENLCPECDEKVTEEQFVHTRGKPFYGEDGWPVDRETYIAQERRRKLAEGVEVDRSQGPEAE